MPRLYHTKSRTGCKRCRDRRVKCDEVHPVCSNCSRHNVRCHYDRTWHPPQASQPASAGPSRQSTASSTESISVELLTLENRDRRIMELGLMHFFTVEVCPTLPGTYLAPAKQVWTVEVPRLALQYDPLLYVVLALSLLYMQSTRYTALQLTDSIPTLRARYLEATVHEHRKAIGDISRPVAEASSFTSALLSFDAFASLRERQLEPYQPPIHWLQLCKGVMSVFRVAIDLVRQDPNSTVNVAVESSSSLFEPSVIFCEANRSRFPYLLERSGDETESDIDHEAYMDTLCYIGAALAALEGGEDNGALLRKLVAYPILLPSRFTDLLGQYKPRALVILAHFFAVASHCSDSWMVGDTPEREIQAIAAQVGQDWQGAMEWPLKTIQRDTTTTGA